MSASTRTPENAGTGRPDAFDRIQADHGVEHMTGGSRKRARVFWRPLCADHDPERVDEDRMLHGAAPHGCLLISETSCEARNVHLDSALLIDT
jgi:hypothetical protein